MKHVNVLYSIRNVTHKRWATNTNFSTYDEAQKLFDTITKQIRDQYEIVARPYGSIKDRI